MTANILFRPDAARARGLDGRMRTRLADSLAYIAAEVAGAIPIQHEKLSGFLQRLARAPVSALVFGAYFDLVFALEAGEIHSAAALLEEILAAPSAPAGLAVFNIGDPSRPPDGRRYLRLINTDPAMRLALRSPPPDVEAAARRRLQEAFQLLEAGFPDLADELRTLIREIVLAVNADDADDRFDGASSFMLWGAIILNAEASDTPIALVEGLAHESGHNLLFGLCADGPLVENDDFDRFPSPLRADPRPMDGIVHATYIIARMHQAVHTVLNAGVLDGEQAVYARSSLQGHAEAFQRGMDTIDRHGRLTPLGHGLLEGASDYMRICA
jgi:hypothetical protein